MIVGRISCDIHYCVKSKGVLANQTAWLANVDASNAMANDPDNHADKGYADLEPSSRLAGRRPATSSVDEEAESGSESDVSLDLASTAASGSENRLYLRLALYAGGNILTLLLVLGLWTVWTLLATFRHPMLWALLCSTALQDIKEDLVSYFNRVLAQDRCVMQCSANT